MAITQRDGMHLRLAKQHLEAFADESALIEDHKNAMDCWDCEAFLQLGIDAFDWLIRADIAFRRAVIADDNDYDEKMERALETLVRGWLDPCKQANLWIARVRRRGYQLDNLTKFQECEANIRSMVKFLDHDEMTEAVRVLRDKAIAEHANGETVEFI